MERRQIGYVAAALLLVLLAFRFVSRPKPKPSSIPAPAPSASAASCDRDCERARIYRLALSCEAHPELQCGQHSATALAAFEEGRCADAKAALQRASVTEAGEFTPVTLAFLADARVGCESCVERDASSAK